jgi:hypothetical protein
MASAPRGADAYNGACTEQTVKGTHRAQLTAPGAPTNEQVDQEYGGDNAPGQSHAEYQPAEDHGYRVDQLPGNAAGDRGHEQDCGQEPVACLLGKVGATDDVQALAQPLGRVGDDVDRADPAAIDTTTDDQVENQNDQSIGQCRRLRQVAGHQYLQQYQGIRQG